MTGLDLSQNSQKWVVLISAKRILGVTDEKCLSQHMLPPWMSLDVLYYFNLSDQDQAPKGFIVTEQIQDVFTEEDQEKGYLFRLNMGERMYVFSCANGVERDEWTQGIQRSRDSQRGQDTGVHYDLVSIDKEIDILTNTNEEDTSD